MTVMERPIYEYPGGMTRSERQAAALLRLEQHRKLRRQMIRNIILAAVIGALSFLCPVIFIRVLLILIALGNLGVGLVLYSIQLAAIDEGQFLKVYPDRLEHRMALGLTGKHQTSVIYFDEIVSAKQDSLGRLAVTVSPSKDSRSRFYIEDRQGRRTDLLLKDNTVQLRFPEAAPKLWLIENCWEKLHYPKKEYKKLDDSDDYYTDEDKAWDPLHKHGL